MVNKMILQNEDPIETLIGGFGKYQAWTLLLIALGRLPMEFQLSNVVFVIPGVDYICLDENAKNATNFCPCEYPLYDKSMIMSSVTSEWNLICDRGYLASLAQSIMQVGILVGSVIYGFASDRYGRKIAILVPMILEVIFIILSSVVPSLWMFLVFRFLVGTSIGGVQICTYVLLIELSGKTFRSYMIGLEEVSFIIGYFTLPMIAYFVREWRYLQLVTSVPWVLTLTYFWFLSESPRWLITAGKKQEAIRLLTYIAKKNNRPTDSIENVINTMYEKEAIMKRQASYLDLFRTPKMRLYTIVTALIWMFCAHTYYGISQYIGLLEGNLYINVMIAAACHAPGVLVIIAVAKYFKRKVSVVTSFLVAAISFIFFIFVPYSMRGIYVAFAIIGQIGAYIAFVLIYLFSSEVFPTIVRNIALGLFSVFARAGGSIAPFVVNIGIEWASITVFSTLTFVAAILCLFLPETKDTVLLNTISQTEQLNTKKSDLW